jgi:type I restriction enzyme S subunit
MSQGEARNYLRSKIKTTSGQNGISGADIKKAIVYLPDSDAQTRIVTRIESRLFVCNSIENTIDVALRQTESMRQSILKKAFEGGL